METWVFCPLCKSKTRIKIRPDTVIRNLPIFCPKCKNTTLMDADGGKCYPSK